MSKAILIIDVEDIDIENTQATYIELQCNNQTRHMSLINHWLKPMPEKLEYKTDRLTLKSNMDEIDNYIKNLGYERVGNLKDTIGAYNACIDEILGEE